MKKLKQRWASLRVDLKKHLTVGAAIAFVVALAAVAALLPWLQPGEWFMAVLAGGMLGFSCAVFAGWLKEKIDGWTGRGVVDREDYLVTGRGGGLGAVVGMAAAVALHLAGVGLWA